MTASTRQPKPRPAKCWCRHLRVHHTRWNASGTNDACTRASGRGQCWCDGFRPLGRWEDDRAGA